MQRLSGQAVPSNKPVVGDALFKIESGIIASWFKNCGEEYPTELFPYRPEVVGQAPADVVLGKGSGLDSIKMWLAKLGVTANDAEVARVLVAVKEFAYDTHRLLTEAEFRTVVNVVLPGRLK